MPHHYVPFYRSNLPHLVPLGATFFVTFRLADSLPQAVVAHLKIAYETKKAKIIKEKRKDYKEALVKERKRLFAAYEHQLDEKPYGACFLKNEEVAELLANKIHAYDGKYYTLIAYCIMPNHVHLLLDFSIQLYEADGITKIDLEEDISSYVQLPKVLQYIKGGSSFAINRMLGRKGQLWQRESYDHVIRNENEWRNVVRYILKNPVKAGLVNQWEDWAFTYLKEGVLGD